MQNSKEFIDNYKENSLKVLEIINNDTKNISNENLERNGKNINQAFSEVYDILNHMEKDLYNKIPKKFVSMLEKNKDDKYKPQIDYSKSINEQKLLKDTRIILSLIYRDYICTDEERRKIILNDKKEMNRQEKKARIKYNYDNLFKKKNMKDNNINEKKDTNIVVYKESIWKKIINFIKVRLHI